MTIEIGIVLAVIVLAFYMFITESFGMDTISVIIMSLLIITGVLSPSEGFAGFTNSATITVACMFVVSSAIYKSGVLNSVGNIIKIYGRRNYLLTVTFIMLLSGSLSAFMNDTAVVALLMPIVIGVGRKTRINPSMLLMPLSFGALLGGICTLIGTSTNILVSGIAESQGLRPIGMFEMAPVGLCFLGVGIVYILLFGRHLLPNPKQKDNLADEYGLGTYLTEISILPGGKSAGVQIRDSHLVKNLDVKILQINRQGISFIPNPGFVLQEGDELKVSCDLDRLRRLMDQEGIKIKSGESLREEIATGGITLIEAIIAVNSKMDNMSLKEYNFRYRFDGATVLAIRHRHEILREGLGNVKLKSGDVLLISATKEQIPELKKNDDVLVISETKHQPFNFKKAAFIVSILAGIVLTAAFGVAPLMLSAAVGVLFLVVLKFIRTDEAYSAIDWKVIFMLAGILSLGAALEKTGAAKLIAGAILDTIGDLGPHVVLSAFFAMTFLSTNFMSNNATAALLTPIAIVTAASMGVDSRPFILCVAFAASLSFMTPMGYQTNVMIYGPGNYTFRDFLRVGTPLNLLYWLLASFLIPYFFPF
jgi:di/tricarboxylate transporter